MKLVLAEKSSVAQSIAKVLGANKGEDGFLIGNGFQAWYLQASGISTDGLLRTNIYKILDGSHVACDSKKPVFP